MVQNEGQDTCRRSQKKRKARGTIQNAKHFRRRNNAQVTHDYHQVRLYNTTKKQERINRQPNQNKTQNCRVQQVTNQCEDGAETALEPMQIQMAK